MNTNNISALAAMVQHAGASDCFAHDMTVGCVHGPEQTPLEWQVLFDHKATLPARIDAAKRIGFIAGIAGWCLPFCSTPEQVVNKMRGAGTDVDYLRKWVEGIAADWLELDHQQAHALFDQRLGVTWPLTYAALINLANTGEVNWGLLSEPVESPSHDYIQGYHAGKEVGQREERARHPDTVKTGVLPISDREKAVWQSAHNEGYQKGYETGAYDCDNQCKQAYDQGKEDGWEAAQCKIKAESEAELALHGANERRHGFEHGFTQGFQRGYETAREQAGLDG